MTIAANYNAECRIVNNFNENNITNDEILVERLVESSPFGFCNRLMRKFSCTCTLFLSLNIIF